MMKHGGNPDLVKWYYNYLIYRDIDIELHGEKKEYSTDMDFPQGRVCSAKFWLIAFDPAIQIINSRGIKGNRLADNCSALLGRKSLKSMTATLQAMAD